MATTFIVAQVADEDASEIPLFDAPLEPGNSIFGGLFIVEERVLVTTPAGLFNAWRCIAEGPEDADVERIILWLAPYIGPVRAQLVERPYPDDEHSKVTTLTIALQSYAAQ